MADLAQDAPAPDALPATPVPAAAPPEVKPEDAPAATAEGDAKPEGEAKAETPPETPDATLARKQLVSAEKKLAKAKAALAQSESLRTRAALADDVENLLKTDPDALFQRFGLTAEDVLTASVSKASGKPPTKTEAEEIAELKRDRDAERASRATAAETQQRQAVNDGVKTMLAADESFELVNAFERHGDVAEAVWNYGKKYPKMTRDQAEKAVRYFARKLETQLEAEKTADADRLAKSKKLGGRFAPRADAPAAGDAPAGDSKTLHNGIVRTAPPVVDDLPQDDAARWKEVKRRAGIK